MIDSTTADRVREMYRTYANSVDGFSARPGQVKMIGAVATALSRRASPKADDADADGHENTREGACVCVVEGPTGTGKTLSYLVGALPVAQEREKKLVIATATVALQEQLVEKDIPRLVEACGVKAKVVLAKGRSRYVCPVRLIEQVQPPNGDLFGGTEAPPPSEDERQRVLRVLAREFESGEWNGELDGLENPIDPAHWHSVTIDSRGCTGRLCEQFSNCPFYAAREQMRDSDIIVTNHDLVLATYRHETDALPSQENCIYVFDEAHHLPEKALAHTSTGYHVGAALDLADRVQATLLAGLSTLGGDERSQFEKAHRVQSDVDALKEHHSALRVLLDQNAVLNGKSPSWQSSVWRFPFGEVPECLIVIGKKIAESADALVKAMDTLLGLLKARISKHRQDRALFEPVIGKAGERLADLEQIVDTWRMLLHTHSRTRMPMARWVERIPFSASGTLDYHIAASPITAAGLLNRILWRQSTGIVLTSATLTALGEFTRFAQRTGLSQVSDVSYVRLASPFDFEKNAILDVPSLTQDPRNPEAHTRDVTQWLRHNVDPTTGTLVLFTSYKQMMAVYSALDAPLRAITRAQGQMSKAQLLAAHRKDRDEQKGAMLFGVNSLAEGVDLPGHYLTHVVIAKLPFAVPSSPIHQAISEWLESIGRNPFIEITVPDASLRLTQAVGRLIRTESDSGRVTILDGRIVTKNYGRQLIASLPAMQRNVA